ncbi:MAG: peptidase domain-containing ABC transporter [Streptococcaceae bacterium]|nr:peptidase domain-containing ABC transporter [Streptococcaceae bacterium]
MRLKRIKQHDEVDCGAACFATIFNSYGEHFSLAYARELVHTNKYGSTLYGINEAAKDQGFESEALSGSMEELFTAIDDGDIKLPFIAHINTSEGLSHFIVVAKLKKNFFVVFDPGSGDKKLSFQEFKELWSGMVITMHPAADWIPRFKKNWRFRKYFNIIENVKSKIILVTLISFVISAISIVGSLLYKKVIDSFILKGQETTISGYSGSNPLEAILQDIISNFNYLFISVIVLYLFQAALSIVRAYFIAEISVRSGKALFLNLFKKLMSLPAAFFYNRESGELLARFQIISEFQSKLSEIIVTIFLESFMALAGGFVLYRISPNLFGVTCLLVLCYLLITIIFIKPLKMINSKIIDANSSTLTVYNQSISGIEEIKMTNAAQRFVKSFKIRVHKFLERGKRRIILQNIQLTLVFLMEALGVVFILWRGSALVLNGVITLGSLVSFETLIIYFVLPLKNIIEKQKEIQDLFVMADKLDDVLEVETEISSNPEQKFPKSDPDQLQLSDLSFSYGAGPLVFEGVNMTFESEKHYAISGKSGTGKTSLLKMMASLNFPDEGAIFFNGVNISESYQAYRKLVSYIPNNPTLFVGTIRENLLISNPDMAEQKFIEVIERTGLSELLAELPEGLDAKVIEDGLNFSSGQRQRIVIARALINEPKILLLDEAFSNLDREAQVLILTFIKEKMQGGILISISHDEELNHSADYLLTVENQQLKCCFGREE